MAVEVRDTRGHPTKLRLDSPAKYCGSPHRFRGWYLLSRWRFLLCRSQGAREVGGDPGSQPAKCSLVWHSTSWHCFYRVQYNQKHKASFFPQGEAWT